MVIPKVGRDGLGKDRRNALNLKSCALVHKILRPQTFAIAKT